MIKYAALVTHRYVDTAHTLSDSKLLIWAVRAGVARDYRSIDPRLILPPACDTILSNVIYTPTLT